MDNREEFGYDYEGNIAYKNYGQPNVDKIRAAESVDSDKKYGYGEEHYAWLNEGQPKIDSIKAAVLNAEADAHRMEREQQKKEETIKARKEKNEAGWARDWNSKAPYNRLINMVSQIKGYFQKNAVDIHDIELLNNFIGSLNIKTAEDLEKANFYFSEIKGLSGKHEIIEENIRTIEENFNSLKSALPKKEVPKKEQPKKEAYGRVKLITKIIAKIRGVKSPKIEEESIEKEGKSR